MQDNQLLTQYARTGSAAAFSQLVARHLPLVHRTCRRELASDTLAEDAAQVVFLLLARKAKTLRTGPSLAGWLFQTARFVAKDARKQEARRRRREEAVMQEAHRQTTPVPISEWDSIEPLLNNALAALKPTDREAILLRFSEGHTLAETGALLGLSEDAARMRCARAVDKLRRYLTSHGAAVTSLVLTGFLTAEAAHPVSAHAAATITQGTITAITTGPTPNVLLLSKGVTHTMKIIKIKYAAVLAATLLAVGGDSLSLTAAPTRTSAPILVSQNSSHPALGDYWSNRQPPVLEALLLPDQTRGQSGMAGGPPHMLKPQGNLQIVTFTSPSSFKAVCRFYTDKLLPPSARPQALGVEGDLSKQSAYAINEHPGFLSAMFSQRTADYNVSVSVYRGGQDKVTAVTLIYSQS